MHAARHQTGDVRHVEDVHRAHLVGDLPHAGEIPEPRIGAAAADDGLGPFALGNGFQFVVVDQLGIFAHTIKRWPVELAAEAQLMPVGQVAAVRQVEAQNRVANLQDRRIG